MILKTGNMWQAYGETDLFCFTANSTIKKNVSLVMGAGMAKQVKDRFPGIESSLGSIIAGQDKVYGIVFTFFSGQLVGAFQTKVKFSESSSLDWIEYSTTELFKLIVAHKWKRVDLNFPGIGLGGLDRDEVLPIISYLPDCVYIWELK